MNESIEYRLDLRRVDELALPFEFETNSKEGTVKVVVNFTPKGDYFKDFSPFRYRCSNLDLTDFVEGDYTIDQIRKDVLEFTPKSHRHY